MARRKKSRNRTLEFDGCDKSVVLSKVTEIRLDKVENEFLYFDRREDGTWSLAFTSKTIPDIEALRGLLIKPEDAECT